MDENAKAQFKWKFYRLTVELNIIVLLVAMSIPVFLIIHSPYTVPIIIGMLALALILFIGFLSKNTGRPKHGLMITQRKKKNIRKKTNRNLPVSRMQVSYDKENEG